MQYVRRLLSAGGWLAHVANKEFSNRNLSSDQQVRPFMLFFWDALALLIATSFFEVSTGVGISGGLPRWAWAPLGSLIVGLVILVNAGWYVGLVPFAATNAADPATPAASEPSEIDLSVRVTGVVENDLGDQRRYRNRPARLDGTMLSVKPPSRLIPWLPESMFVGKAPVRPDLAARKGLGIERGTAYLVTATRPALRFAWKYGPLVLAFESTAERDLAFGFLSARLSS